MPAWEQLCSWERHGHYQGGRAADFIVAFDCTSQEKAAHGHVVYAVQEVSKTASKGAQNGSHCPGNERCVVEHVSNPNVTNYYRHNYSTSPALISV
jgi:hypothetical protein